MIYGVESYYFSQKKQNEWSDHFIENIIRLVEKVNLVILFGLFEVNYSDNTIVQEQKKRKDIVMDNKDPEQKVCKIYLNQHGNLPF